MRRSKKFESATRRIALARLRASPKLWREYLQQRGSWLYLCAYYGALSIVAFVGFVGLLSLPFGGGYGLAGAHTVMGVVGLVTTGLATTIALMQAIRLVQELLCSRSLAIASQLPIADGEFVSNRLERSLLASVLLLVVSLAFFVGLICGLQLSWQQNVLILGLAVLEWLIVVALFVLIPVYLPRLARRETFGVMTTLGVGAFTLSLFGPFFKIVQQETVAIAVLGAFPTGWPLLMLEFGILRDGPIAIWWLLLPTAILATLAVFSVGRFQRRYDVAEISFEDGGVASAVLTRHFAETLNADAVDILDIESDAAPARAGVGQLIRSWFIPAKAEEADDECDAEFARECVLSRQFLEPYDWSNGRWIESTVGNMLNDREKLVADLLVVGAPQWTKRQTKILVGGLATVTVLYLISLKFGAGLMAVASQLCFGFLTGMLTGAWRTAIWRAKTGHACSITGALPITTQELLRLTMILGAVRAAFLSPFFYAMATLGIYGITRQWEFGRAAYLAAKGVLVFVALHQWSMLALIPTTDSWRFWRKVTIGMLLGFLIISTVGAAVMLFYVGQSEIKSFMAAAVMLGLGWFAQKWHHRAMTYEPYDFITLSRSNFALQQEQQSQRREKTKVW